MNRLAAKEAGGVQRVFMKSYEKRYLTAVILGAASAFAWHNGYQEVVVGGMVVFLVLIFEKLDAGED
jgi:hypothetical protein